MVQTADYQQIKKHVGIRSKIGNGFIYGLLIIWDDPYLPERLWRI